MSEFLIIPNRDGTTYSSTISKATWNDAKEYKGAIHMRAIKPLSSRKFHCKPNTLTMAYENLANTGYIPKYDQWIRNNDMGVPFYSWTLLFKENSYYTEVYDVTMKYIVQYKGMGKDVALDLVYGQRLTHPFGSIVDAADSSGTKAYTEKHENRLVAVVPDHDNDIGPNRNGYDDLDITDVSGALSITRAHAQ